MENNENKKEIIKVTCSVERIRYYKEQFGIIVCSIDKVKEGTPRLDSNGTLILKGTMPKPIEGNTYNVTAEYVQDLRWGDQYNIICIFSAITFKEGDIKGQQKFLQTIFTPLQVENMYKALDDPFQVLKEGNAQELVKVSGCGMTNATKWIDRFKENFYLGKIYMELAHLNLTNNMIKRLMDRYHSPDVIIEKLKYNPYVLCNEVQGIGWKTADKIALDGGIGEFSTLRIKAYIVYYLTRCGDSGNSWITPDELMGAILEEIGDDVPDANVTKSIHELGNKLWWDTEKTKIGLRKYYDLECNIAQELIRLRDAESSIKYNNWQDTIKYMEFRQGWEFTEEQKAGIALGLKNNVTVITGSGGTGKSSLVAGILEVLKHCSFAQCALSGRAASRLTEITGEEGYTIHRLLGYPKGEKHKQMFVYHDENYLPYDIIIIDEISMIDGYLFYDLLRAIKPGAKVFLLGDPGQLESIGCGSIAYDMICSNEISTVTLTQIHRQAAKSAIITESNKVRHGMQLIEKEWVGTEIRGELQDLTLKCYSDASNTYYEIMKAFSADMAKDDFHILDTQIIVPIKSRGSACTYELNNTIQELYNPENENKKSVIIPNKGKPYVLREGDKVINTVNNYKTFPLIFNGNIGIIKEITITEDEDEIMVIDFVGIGEVVLYREFWGNLELAYAITTHKSQGSEFHHVIFGIDFSSYALLSREMVYTGITRAKNKCTFIAQTGALRMSVCKAGVNIKQTHLQQCLYNVAHPKLIF